MHLKRLKAPKSWELKRKENKFVTRPKPRGKQENVLSLNMLLRNTLGHVKTMKEAKLVLNARKVLVNGKPRTSIHFPVNIFDLIEIPSMKKTYTLTFDQRGKLVVDEIKSQDFRLARIENKTMVKGGKLQLNLFDGSNVLSDKKDYNVGDVLKLGLKDSKIKGQLKLRESSDVFVIKGSHIGKTAKVSKIIENLKPKEVILESDAGEFRTKLENVYVIR